VASLAVVLLGQRQGLGVWQRERAIEQKAVVV
jgi:hypothetical protein